MDRREVERILSRIESLLDLHGENSFKSRAYGRAARAVRSADVDVVDVVRSGAELEVDGIGSGIAGEIREIVETGTSSQLEDLMERTPNGLLDVLSIRGLGSKKVRTLWHELGVESLDDLEEKGKRGEIAGLKGFGAKTEANILQGIADLKANVGRMRLHTATDLAGELLPLLRGLPSAGRVEIAGRLRRGGEEFGALEFVLETERPEDVLQGLTESDVLSEVQSRDGTIYGTIDGTSKVLILDEWVSSTIG